MDWNSNRRRHVYKRGTFRRRKNLLLSCSKMTILQIDVVSINNPCAQSHTLSQNFEQGIHGLSRLMIILGLSVMSQVGEAAKVFLTGCLHCHGRGRNFWGLQPARICCIKSVSPSPDDAERGTVFKNMVASWAVR